MRLLSSGSVTSDQSSDLDLPLDFEEEWCFLELEEGCCLEEREDILEDSFSVDDPDPCLRLAASLLEEAAREVGGCGESVCRGVVGSSASSGSSGGSSWYALARPGASSS